jgi:hypothetical protein
VEGPVKVEAFAAQDLEKTVLVAIANNPAPWFEALPIHIQSSWDWISR